MGKKKKSPKAVKVLELIKLLLEIAVLVMTLIKMWS